MNMTKRAVKGKFKKLGLLTESNEALIFSQFKNLVTIKEYGKKNRIVFTGIPNETLIAFYVSFGTYPEMLREAFDWYLQMTKGSMVPVDEKNVMFGNSGIPDQYQEIEWLDK
jgi:hypothetical protein